MKKIILNIGLVLVLVISLFSLTGCGTSSNIQKVKDKKDSFRFEDYTFEQVLKKGNVKNIKWSEEQKSDALVYVTMTGKVNGDEIKVVYAVRPESVVYDKYYRNGELKSISQFDKMVQEFIGK